MNPIERVLARLAFSGQKKVRLMRQLQRLIRAGVPLNRSLHMLRQLYSREGKKPREPLALMIREWQARLGQGKSLSESMHGWIKINEEMIIQAGEQSDQIATALEDALHANGASRAIRNTILGGLAYPMGLLFALAGMLYMFSTEIVPTFASIVPPEQWTGNAAIMYSVSRFMVDWLLLILMGLGLSITAIILTLPLPMGRVRRYLEKVPPWSIYKLSQGASYMISLRGFLSAGMPIPEALRKMLRTGNPYFRERVSAILARINMGRNLGEAMRETGYGFPDDDISGEVSIYAGLDNFAESLDLLAKEWIDGATARAQAVTKVLGNLLLILVAACIGFIAVSMFELNTLISEIANN